MDKYERGLFIFRRDFRIIDNIGLNLLNNSCKNIYTIFIFTPEQVTNENKFKSDNSVQFMIESLQDLSKEINNKGGQLMCFYGNNDTIVTKLIKDLNIDIVCFNVDYTPYAIKRDSDITKICNKLDIAIEYGQDYYLHPPGTILNGAGNTYQKFTPFYNESIKHKVTEPSSSRKIHFAKTYKDLSNKISLSSAMKKFVGDVNEDILVRGGRPNALEQLKKASKNIKNYPETRNDLALSTSELSAYIKFGCVSIREVYKTFKSKTDFIRQLYWRDFYANVLFAFPYVLGSSMKLKYNKINWKHNTRWFNKWCAGETGFPIVDAGMRQMNQSGYMHNRARLIVASFLIKTLLISWEKGEKYFAQSLVDYDVASNNGNWQWTASSGADSQPYFRIFNPWRQAAEYDPNCEYIKKWIPELKDVPVKDIMDWKNKYSYYKDINYPKPICDYEEQRDKALEMYKEALN